MQPLDAEKRRFQCILIKPSHYDDDGYVIRWWRAMIPSNSLAAVYGIAADCAERQVLGPDVAIDIEVIDETNARHRCAGAARTVPAPRQFRACRARWRSVEPVSPRSRHCPPVPGGRNSRCHRRLPCFGMPLDAGRTRGRTRRLPGDGRRHVRRRGRGPARFGAAATPRRKARAADTIT